MQLKARRKDLDCAKGLGILLVVLGHIVPSSTPVPDGNLWYVYLRELLYEFHMPFFMFLSGYVTFMSGAARPTLEKWPALVKKRAQRLLLPFLIFGFVLVIGKWVTSKFFFVDNLPQTASQALLGMIWDTDFSPATSVWYVAVLFVFCVVTPPLLTVLRDRLTILVGSALILYALPVPHVLYLNRCATYYVFFVLGGLFYRNENRWLPVIDRYAWLLLGFFIAVIVLFASPPFEQFPWPVKMLISGVISMPALLAVIRRPVLTQSMSLLLLGEYSFVIYLLNTPCIGVLKGILFKIEPWTSGNFLFYFLALVLSGVVGPIVIKKFVLRPFPVLDRITS